MTSTASQTTRYKTALLNTPTIADSDTDDLPPTEITLFKAVFLTDRFQCFFHVDLPCIVRLGFGLVYASIVICAFTELGTQSMKGTIYLVVYRERKCAENYNK